MNDAASGVSTPGMIFWPTTTFGPPSHWPVQNRALTRKRSERPRRLSSAALNALRNRNWSGGYAELKAAIKSLALGTLEEEIGMDDVAHLLVKTPTAALGLPLDLPLREAREIFERLYFEHHLQIDGSNMTRLAEKTGLERTHLYRKLKQLGISVGKRHDNGDG